MPGDEREQRWTVEACATCSPEVQTTDGGTFCRECNSHVETRLVEVVPASRLAEAEAELQRINQLARDARREPRDTPDPAERLINDYRDTDMPGYQRMFEERQQARADLERAREALEEIADQDPVELALDPTWPQRIARAALAALPVVERAPELSADGGSIRTEQEPAIESETRDGD